VIRAMCLARDARGVTAVEFALVAPLMLMTIMGLFDMGHAQYTRALLEGAIDKASRAATIEASSTTSIDARVTTVVKQIAPSASLTFNRTTYSDFSDVGMPEDFDDVDKNGTCDNGEPFEDANGNGTYDLDRGKNGNGGARDAVLYTVSVSYKRILPIGRLIGQSDTMKMSVMSVLRNQPYGIQAFTETKNCP
jgi:Flp pilus assembly pilin Flp